MDHKRIWEIALQQSAVDLNCKAEDFFGGENRVVVSQDHPDAKKYYKLPHVCQMVSYGPCVIASVREDVKDAVESYLKKVPARKWRHLFCAVGDGKMVIPKKFKKTLYKRKEV